MMPAEYKKECDVSRYFHVNIPAGIAFFFQSQFCVAVVLGITYGYCIFFSVSRGLVWRPSSNLRAKRIEGDV